MADHERSPEIGEELYLTREMQSGVGTVTFRSVAEPDMSLGLWEGMRFEFSEPVQYECDCEVCIRQEGIGGVEPKTISSNPAELAAGKNEDGEYAMLVFASGQQIPLENIIPTETIRAKRILERTN